MSALGGRRIIGRSKKYCFVSVVCASFMFGLAETAQAQETANALFVEAVKI